MFNLVRKSFTLSSRGFSTSSRSAYDVAKLTLVGRLAREPELRVTKRDKEYVAYTVVTTNYPPPSKSDTGEYAKPGATYHRVISFGSSVNNYLTKLKKGTLVFVEANYEVREPNPNADAGSYDAVRQVFLRHENIRVLTQAREEQNDAESEQ